MSLAVFYEAAFKDNLQQFPPFFVLFDEIEAVHTALAAGELESSLFSWEDSIAQARILDRIRTGQPQKNIG